MLPASIEESPDAPAPTTVCSSSMNVMTWPSASRISLRTAFSRSSNSPRYFAPATIALRSSETSRRPLSESGTSPATRRWASPSTTAVLPTPGSPIRTGLFFVRRARTWTTRRISVSRPITGSSLPARATAVMSTPYWSRADSVPSASALVTRLVPRSSLNLRGQRVGRDLEVAQHLLRVRGDRRERDQQVLGGDVRVAELLGAGLGVGEHAGEAARQLRLGDGGPGRRRELADGALRGRVDHGGVGADGGQEGGDGVAGDLQDRVQEVAGLDVRVAAGERQAERRRDGVPALGGELVRVHGCGKSSGVECARLKCATPQVIGATQS